MLCRWCTGSCASRCVFTGRVYTRPCQELARGVSVLRCSGWDIGKDGVYWGDQSVKAFSPCIRGVYVSVLGAGDSVLEVVTHAGTAGSQEALATISAASCFCQYVNRKIPNWHRTSLHDATLWAKLLIFFLKCRWVWKMDQRIWVWCIVH